jgi:hypothetical protein
MVYEPEYADGEIVAIYPNRLDYKQNISVDFLRGYLHASLPEEFNDSFAIQEFDFFGQGYLITVPKGREQEYCDILQQLEGVDSFRRDLKFEERYNALELLVSKATDLRDDVEIPKSEYNKKLEEIAEYIYSIQEQD